MDKVSSPSDAGSLGSVASFLASLSGGNSDSPEAKLFADFLSHNQGLINDQPDSNHIKLSLDTPSKSTTTVSTAVMSHTMPVSLKTLTSAWHYVLDKLQNKIKFISLLPRPPIAAKTAAPTAKSTSLDATANSAPATSAAVTNNSTSPSSTPTAQAQTSSDSNTPAVTTSAATPPTSVVPAAPVTTPTPPSDAADGSTLITFFGITSCANGSATAAATDPSQTTTASDGTQVGLDLKTPKTIADLLAELEVLAQLIAKQLQLTSTSQGAAAQTTFATSTPSSQAIPGNDPVADTGLMAALNSFSADLQGMGLTGITNANTATDNDPVSGTNSTSPPTTAQALTDLLSLAQVIAKQLDAAQNANAIVPISSPGQATDNISPLSPALTSSVQLTPDMRVVLNDVQFNAPPHGGVNRPSGLTQNIPAPILTDISNDRFLAATNNASDASFKAASAPAGIPKNMDLSQTAFNYFSADIKQSSGTSTPSAGFIPLPSGASLTDGESTNSSFDLNRESAGSNNYTAPTHNAANDVNNLPSALEAPSANSPYSFASQLATTKATATGALGLPPAVEQVMFQLNRNVKSGNDQMTLQLNPAELGRVSIKLDIGSDGKVQGTVVANNPATLDLLLKDVRSLERALQDAGLRADPGSLQFSLGGQAGNSFDQSANEFSKTAGNSTTQNIITDPTVSADHATEIYYVTPGRVNLRV